MEGEYLIWLPDGTELVIPNLIPDGGKDEFYKMIFQDVTAVAGGTNWYIGMCDQLPTAAMVLADITTEPTGTFGYARKAVVRSAVGWPTISSVNGRRAITSITATWTAAGGPFSRTFSRLFLTNQANTKLYSLSGAITVPLVVLDTQSISAAYRLYI